MGFPTDVLTSRPEALKDLNCIGMKGLEGTLDANSRSNLNHTYATIPTDRVTWPR